MLLGYMTDPAAAELCLTCVQRIIPQFLMGVRPVDLAWRKIVVHPQPGTQLTHASMRVPTLRGEVQ